MYDRYLNMKEKNMTNQELIYLCRQLSMLLKAGISLLEGISILKEDADTEDGKKILAVIYDELLESGDIQSALEKAAVFPPYFIHMVKMGDLSGNLDDTFASLAVHYEREENLSGSIRDALTYPLIMIGMLSAVLRVLIVKVMPVFDQVFRELGMEMGGAATAVLRLGNGLRRYAFLFLLLFFLLALGLLYLTRTTSGRIRLRTLARKLPFSRGLMYDTSCARFASGMSVALKSGLDTEESFDLVTRLVDDPAFCEKITSAREAIQKGEDFSDALNQASIFSGMDARMVAVGFRSGEADTALSDIAERLQDKTDEKLQNLAGLLEPSLVALLSILVGLILLSVMLPLVNVMSAIG